MATGNKVYMSSNRGVYFSIFLFLLIIVGTFWLYYQNNNTLKEKTKILKEDIKIKNNNLKKLNKDDVLQVFSLLKSNMKDFELKEKYSDITILINKIEKLERDYNLNFKSFSYSKGKISLKTESIKGNGKPSEKIIKFIGDFRKKIVLENGKLEKIINPKIEEFDLDFVKSFSGNNKIIFNIVLNINGNKYKLIKSKKSLINKEIGEEEANLEKTNQEEVEVEEKEEEQIENINDKNNISEKKMTIAEKIKLQNEKNRKNKEKQE